MDPHEIKDDWATLRGKLRQEWAQQAHFTGREIQQLEGQQEVLLSHIQQSTGASRMAVEVALKEHFAAAKVLL